MVASTGWKQSELGQVYGIALDDSPNPNIFIARSTVHCGEPDTFTVLIYKIDGTTWNVSNYIVKNPIAGLPESNVNWMRNTGPGLGNICYDKWHKQIFATNFEDGRIYRIKDNGGVGNVKNWFPQTADDMSPGFVPRGLRIWGVGIYGKSQSDVRVYYSMWNSDKGHKGTGYGKNEIRSIALDYNGEFIPSTDRSEFIINNFISGLTYSNPVSDIEFSFDGTMLLGERTMYKRVQPPDPGPYFPYDDMGPCPDNFGYWSHESNILEYNRDLSGLYNFDKRHIVGSISGYPNNSCGGVDLSYGHYDSLNFVNSFCDSIIVGTGDFLFRPTFAFEYIYGLNLTGRTTTGLNSVYIDLNGEIQGGEDKTSPGDVDVYRKDLCSDTNTCMTILRDTIYCDSTETYIYEFQIRNNSYEKFIEQMEIAVDSPQPPNYVVAVPSTINVNPPLAPRAASQVYRVKLVGPGANAYTEVCYTLSAHYVNDDCPWCCYIEKCIKLPICSCAEVLQDSVYFHNNQYNYNFTLQNGTQYNVTKIQLTSPGINPITFIPQIFHFTIPIVPGQQFPNLTAQILGGAAGMTIPVRIKLFSNDFECCYIENDISLPFFDCTQSLIYDSLNCINGQLGQYISLQNSTACNVTRVELFSSGNNPITFVPQTVNYGTPILPGQQFPVITTQTINSIPGNTYTVRVIFYSGSIECCYVDHTYTQLTCSQIISQGMYLNLNAFIEGRYNPVLNLMTGGEIQVELRNNFSPYALVETANGYLDENGNCSVQFHDAENGVNYYIVLKNSNIIETWSKSPGQSFSENVLNFDFLSSAQAYGNNLGIIDTDPLRYGIHSGDVDQDRQVDISDISVIFNDSKTFNTGASDLNGDGVTDLTDLMIAFNNASNYVSAVRP